jgi:hypothetical protein
LFSSAAIFLFAAASSASGLEFLLQRVYYRMHSKRVILLCEGGDKRKQNADIKRAIKRWNEWQKRGKK